MKTPHKRLILEIARDIQAEWTNVHYAAKPYLEAMLEMTTMDKAFGMDNAYSIILYFLGNASSFRGPKARELKAELKAMAGIK
jgi:hypothetical protein